MKSKQYQKFLYDNRKAKEELDLQLNTEYLARDVFGRLHVITVDRLTPSGIELKIHKQDGTVTVLPEWAVTFIGFQKAMARV